jgi:hypothetical protein
MRSPFGNHENRSPHVLFALAALAGLTVVGLAGTVVGQHVFSLPPFAPVALLKRGRASWRS